MEWSHPPSVWHCSTPDSPPAEFVRAVQQYTSSGGERLARVLWNRQQRDLSQLRGFLDSRHYRATAAAAFGGELQQAIARLQRAIRQQGTRGNLGRFRCGRSNGDVGPVGGTGAVFLTVRSSYRTTFPTASRSPMV